MMVVFTLVRTPFDDKHNNNNKKRKEKELTLTLCSMDVYIEEMWSRGRTQNISKRMKM